MQNFQHVSPKCFYSTNLKPNIKERKMASECWSCFYFVCAKGDFVEIGAKLQIFNSTLSFTSN